MAEEDRDRIRTAGRRRHSRCLPLRATPYGPPHHQPGHNRRRGQRDRSAGQPCDSPKGGVAPFAVLCAPDGRAATSATRQSRPSVIRNESLARRTHSYLGETQNVTNEPSILLKINIFHFWNPGYPSMLLKTSKISNEPQHIVDNRQDMSCAQVEAVAATVNRDATGDDKSVLRRVAPCKRESARERRFPPAGPCRIPGAYAEAQPGAQPGAGLDCSIPNLAATAPVDHGRTSGGS